MTNIPAQAAMGWGSSKTEPRPKVRLRIRDIVPPLAAVALIMLAHLAFGAVQPIASMPLSAALVIIAIAAMFTAGPRHVTLGMLVGAGALALMGITGLAGPLHEAAPHLAILFAAGALWIVGYIAARHHRALDIAWTTVMWTSIAYCAWMFFLNVSVPGERGVAIASAFETPASASVLFGLFAMIGTSRILHVIKQMDAEALPRSRMIEQLLRSGLTGILLLAISLTCLLMAESRPGIIMTLAVMVALTWWDTLSITTREHRGMIARLAAIVAPFVAIGLAVWGISLAWISDETIAPGIGLADKMPNLQRIEAYMSAWAQSPAFGHGLGSIGDAGSRTTTLFNAKAMLAPGQAHNVFITWLVETGIFGLALLVLVVGAMYTRIFGALRSRSTPRTFLRLAVGAGVLLLLHGVTDSSLDLPSATWLYALLLGAACGVATGRRIEPQDETQQES